MIVAHFSWYYAGLARCPACVSVRHPGRDAGAKARDASHIVHRGELDVAIGCAYERGYLRFVVEVELARVVQRSSPRHVLHRDVRSRGDEQVSDLRGYYNNRGRVIPKIGMQGSQKPGITGEGVWVQPKKGGSLGARNTPTIYLSVWAFKTVQATAGTASQGKSEYRYQAGLRGSVPRLTPRRRCAAPRG